MFDQETLHAIGREAQEKKWSYPQLFDAWKNAGVERYEVDVAKHQHKYVGGGGAVHTPAPEGWQVLTVDKKFDRAALMRALSRVQKGETTYPQFLEEIAAAGVGFYRVDMKPRTITYHGLTPKDTYKESVPTPAA